VYAVHVLEDIELDRNEFRKELGKRIQGLFQQVEFRNVNAVVLSSYRLPDLQCDVRGNVMFIPDLKYIKYRNQFVDSTLKVDIGAF